MDQEDQKEEELIIEQEKKPSSFDRFKSIFYKKKQLDDMT